MEAIQKLESVKARLVEYLKLKVEQADWHGVSDAANDIREVEAKIAVLKELQTCYTSTQISASTSANTYWKSASGSGAGS